MTIEKPSKKKPNAINPSPTMIEKYARARVEGILERGESATATWLRVNPHSKSTRVTANRRAHEYEHHPQIKARVAELMDEARSKMTDKLSITLERLTEMSLEAYEAAKGQSDPGGMVRAVAQLSKMHGFDAAERRNERSPLAEALDMIAKRRAESTKSELVH